MARLRKPDPVPALDTAAVATEAPADTPPVPAEPGVAEIGRPLGPGEFLTHVQP